MGCGDEIGISLQDLKNPSYDLQCVLSDLVCKYDCSSLKVYTDNEKNLIFNINNVEHKVLISNLLDVRVVGFDLVGEVLRITMSNGEILEAPLSNRGETTTHLMDNHNLFSYVNEDQELVTLQKVESVIPLVDGTVLTINVNGVTGSVDLCSITRQCETNTNIVDDENSFIYTNENNQPVTIPKVSSVELEEDQGNLTAIVNGVRSNTISGFNLELSEEHQGVIGTNSITMNETPNLNKPVRVFRNGLRLNSSEFSIIGNNITFSRPFEASDGAQSENEFVLIDFFK